MVIHCMLLGFDSLLGNPQDAGLWSTDFKITVQEKLTARVTTTMDDFDALTVEWRLIPSYTTLPTFYT